MHAHYSLFLATLLVLGVADPLLSQETGETEEPTLTQALLQGRQFNLTDPSLVSPASLPPSFQGILSATRDKTQVAVEIGLRSLQVARSEFFSSVKVAGPIGEKDSEADLATLDGLANQATVALRVHLLTPSPDAVFGAFFASGDQTSQVGDELFNLLSEALKKEGVTIADPTDLSTNDITEHRGAILDALGFGRGIKLFDLEAKYAAPKTFEFRSPTDLTKATERHDGYSISASAGILPLRKAFYFAGVTYRHEVEYKGKAEQQICTPLGTGGALQCSNLVLGAPAKKETHLGQVEMRRYFRNGTLAINPRYSYDFEGEVSGAELPFYFLRDETGRLNGGISVGWRSDTEEYVVSAFVGSMRNPFGR